MSKILTSSSGSGQNEEFRIGRLEKVSKIYDIQIEDLNRQDFPNIVSLHDHKGELSVYWTDEPTEEQKHIIGLIWELQNELSENIVHKLEEEDE